MGVTVKMWVVIMYCLNIGVLVLPMNKKPLPSVVLPRTKQSVEHKDYVHIMAVFLKLPMEAKVELAKAIIRGKKKLDDPKVVQELKSHGLVDDGGGISPVTQKIIAGVASFEHGQLVIEENAEIKGKVGPLAEVQKSSLKDHDHGIPDEQYPLFDIHAQSFTIHDPVSDHCCTRDSDGKCITIKRKSCSYCKHQPENCKKTFATCQYCRSRSKQKIFDELGDGHYIVEFRDENQRSIAWYNIHHLKMRYEDVALWATRRLPLAEVQ
jgi:hypothetical protein